jgi:LacI family transcriptional regulator
MRKGPEHATLQTISKLAKVSTSTASRVLNAPSDSAARRWASTETIRRVREAAAAQGYRPNPQAVGLRTRRSNLVGVVVPRLQDYVLATIYEGVDEAATEAGVATFVTNSLDDTGKQALATENLLARRVDGLIYGDAHFDGEFLAGVAKRGVPFVLVSRSARGFPSVTTDDHLGGRLVGHHLAEAGRRDVAILAGQPFASTAIHRTKGAVEALREAGIEVPAHRVVYGPFDADGGRAATEQVLARRPYPDAIFATNDFAAIGALGVLRDHGLTVPDDVALAGYNDTPLARSLAVPLTTVLSPMHEMGRQGFAMLTRVLRGEEAEPVLLAPTLVTRASTT